MKPARALLLCAALVALLVALPSPASANHCNTNQDLNCVGSHGNQDDGDQCPADFLW